MIEENKFAKRQIIVDVPETFPELTKRVLNLDDYISDQPSIKKLGKYAILLNTQKKKSIYKKLLSKDPKSNLTFQEMKEIRNKYLKKLVESNSFYFPKELSLDEYKKPTNTKEERINKILQHLEEIAKKEKNNKGQKKKNIDSRKESLLENKRNRTESLEIEKKKVKNEENEENEENGENEEKGEEVNEMEENDNGEASYYEEENYAHPDDDDSQNYNYYSDDGGNDEGDDY